MIQSSERPHLLLFGWYRPGTGFTRVLEALMPHLAQDYRVTWMGVGYQGEAFNWAEGVRLEPTDLHGGDMVGAYGARLRWGELQPDLVFALNDLWYLVHYSRELAGILDHVPMVGYLPLDGHIQDPQQVAELLGFSRLVTYTRSAALDLTEALRAMAINTRVDCLGHGVDLHRFHPLLGLGDENLCLQRMRLAQQFFHLSEPSFVVLNAARPDPRKRIDLTLESFARFVQGRPANIYLCLHQAFAHPQFVNPLREQANALGIAERILWYPKQAGPLDDAELNWLYNACAVGINTAVGEGFGLVSFEHAATGAPQVLPDQDALRELWGDAALRIATRPLRTEYSPLVMVEPSVTDAARSLARLNDDGALYSIMARAARQHCEREDLDWGHAGTCLRQLLSEELGKSRIKSERPKTYP
ncbi:glycosyltransferase family 4 protein [Methylovulum miyakonense]|uniref:glycosyltransferase family 4 protein n=1 Tax=Methylovulum miyakonense TaxID=645578 RepID=UPI00037F75E5|nr:glycosyltransferase family 4 protein [Methylovulum miyakonense]